MMICLNVTLLEINGLPLHDYFESESDVILGYVYLSLMSKESHPVLLDYMIENKRWDLLLLDSGYGQKDEEVSTNIVIEFPFL